MKNIIIFIFMLLLSISHNVGMAQTSKITPLTADSLSSGNYKDVLTSFFQLAVSDLAGPQKSISFASNPYAILARANKNLLVDTNYVKYKHLRDLNFNFSALMDSSYRLSGFSFGAKYALINKRDYTVSKKLVAQGLKEEIADSLTTDIAYYVRDTMKPKYLRDSVLVQLHKWNTDSSFTYNSLSQQVKKVIDSIIDSNHLDRLSKKIKSNQHFSLKMANDTIHQSLLKQFQNKPLWTISGSSTFKPNTSTAAPANSMVANNVYLSSEFLVGLLDDKKTVDLELDVIAGDSISTDNTLSYQNLNRNIFSFEPGINFVFKSKSQKPFFEFKLSGTYYHVLSKLYPSENADNSTINGEFRIRVINDIWIPLTFKVDQNGRVYGTMDLKLNFSTFAPLLNKKS